MKSKEEATRKAKALLSKMKTKGWKIRVHENLGWHYSIVSGCLCVYPNWDHKSYYAMLSDGDFPGTTPADWSHTSLYKDPNKAVVMVLKSAENFVDKRQQIIIVTKKSLGLI